MQFGKPTFILQQLEFQRPKQWVDDESGAIVRSLIIRNSVFGEGRSCWIVAAVLVLYGRNLFFLSQSCVVLTLLLVSYSRKMLNFTCHGLILFPQAKTDSGIGPRGEISTSSAPAPF
jgi:hypothetical protein